MISKFIWVQPQMFGNLENWSTEITYAGAPCRTLERAIRAGELDRGHDDFWIAEVAGNKLLHIWHTNGDERIDAEDSELSKVAIRLGCSYA